MVFIGLGHSDPCHPPIQPGSLGTNIQPLRQSLGQHNVTHRAKCQNPTLLQFSWMARKKSLIVECREDVKEPTSKMGREARVCPWSCPMDMYGRTTDSFKMHLGLSASLACMAYPLLLCVRGALPVWVGIVVMSLLFTKLAFP